MDNLTHSLIGLAASKAGLERLSPGTTTLCILAANAPDADLAVLIFGGRWQYLQHHRGITHSIIGALTLAIALPVAFYLTERLLSKVRHVSPRFKLKGLLLASLLVTATHPIMDWTNNYGMRFLLPWSGKWLYGDFVFIIDPFIWMVLGGAAFLLTSQTKRRRIVWFALAIIPTFIVLVGAVGLGMAPSQILLRVLWILALIVLVVLYHRETAQRFGSKIAIAALVVVMVYLGGLAATHAVALRQAQRQANEIATKNSEHVLKIATMPTMANPTAWISVMETERATYRFNLSLLNQEAGTANVIRFAKPTAAVAESVNRATNDQRAAIFLNFARFPVVQLVGDDCVTQTLVQFADLRYTEPGKGRGTFSLDVPVDCPAQIDPR